MSFFSPTVIIVAGVVISVVVIVVTQLITRGVFSKISKKKAAEAARLMATGAKARATITAVRSTGTIVNYINIQCIISFRLEPVGGAPAFDGEKKTLINQTQMPRVGDIWPAYYDLTDPTDFVVVSSFGGTPDEVAIFEEFGLEHPLGHLH